MKKTKPLSLHQIQNNSPSLTKKKSPLSVKQKTSKSPLSKKSTQTFKHASQPEDYIIINDNIYSANTFTQRNCYDQFLSKVKKQKQEQRKSFLFKQTLDDSQTGKLKKGRQSTKKKFKKLSPQDLIKGMSLDEKREMFYKLQQEIKSNNGGYILPVDLPSLSENNKQSQPCSTQSFENDLSERMRMDSERERQQKLQMLQEKLQTLKMQLLFKWQGQLQRLQELFRRGKISEKEKQNKSIIIEKLKDHKLKIIQCTKTLFQKILQQDSSQGEQTQKKNEKIEAILQSLHSLPSLQSLKDQEIDKQPNIDHLKVNQKPKISQNKLILPNEQSYNFQNNNNINNNQQIIANRNNINQGKTNKKINEQSLLNSFNQDKNQFYSFSKNKNINAIDSSPLEIVQDKSHQAFLSEFNEDIENKKIKIRQQLVSPLSFINNSPNKLKFDQYQEVTTIVNTGFNNLPSRSEEMLRQLLQIGETVKDNKQEMNKLGIQKGQSSKFSLKLDLRLDEVVLGQDEYPQCEKDQLFKTHVDLKVQDLKIKEENVESKIENNQGRRYNLYNKVDGNIKQKMQNLEGLSVKTEQRIVRDSTKATKKRSLIQFTQEKIQPTQIIQEQIIQSTYPIVQKIPLNNQLHQNNTQQLPKNINQNITNNNYTQHSKISLLDLSKSLQPQSQKQLPSQQLKIQLNKLSLTQQQTHTTLQSPIPTQLKQQQNESLEKMESIDQMESLDQLECHQATHDAKPTIDIPMILSQQKMETLALQQNRLFRENIDKRIAFQMGCIQLQASQCSSPHFTTLVDVNSYIVGLYEFMMKKYMSSLVDSLNIPYGKSAIDKLYSLHTQGFVLQESYNQMNNILSEAHFKEYQRQMMLTVRKCSQYETAHNRAVFQAFTKSINVYRPYYQLQGEVFPWIVSEKGITFYEITQDNIEEVFQKSKIKVLEYCTSLCGIHPPSQVKNDEQLAIVNNKNQQNLNKIIKSETLQQFQEWKIRFVNFDCLVKMLLGKLILADIINQVTQEIQVVNATKETLPE